MDYGFLIRSILIQVIIFCIIPFFYWLIRKRQSSFFNYVGLKQIKKTGSGSKIAVFSLGYIVIYSIVHFVPAISQITQPSAYNYQGLGVAAILPALLIGFIQQALSEEILFRGFVGKRFITKLGFNLGNLSQATLFGALHVLMSISSERNILSYIVIFTSTALGGWLLGYLNEKLSGGSIFPSILIHGLGNFIMVMTAAF